MSVGALAFRKKVQVLVNKYLKKFEDAAAQAAAAPAKPVDRREQGALRAASRKTVSNIPEGHAAFDVLTRCFPICSRAISRKSLLNLAIERGLVEIHLWNLRDWAKGKKKAQKRG